MADIFISYARADEHGAAAVGLALGAQGYKVWRDDQLPAHRSYAEVIEERLGKAKAVIVLWSAEAARSQWVRAEADSARNAGKLIQASLDSTVPPLPFNQVQCADLSGSDPTAARGWNTLIASVAELAPLTVENKAPKGSGARRALSICVLPFQNMSGDPEQEYFSDGICEDITTDLSKVSALGVTARNTAFTFKGRSVNVGEVAAQLGVSHVLEGSVRKAGQRVRITAQLIDGVTGEHLWADRYDRDLDDIFAIQDEISQAIVAALKLKLMPAEKRAIEQRGTHNADAYNLYLLARQYWATGNVGDRRREERVMRICGRAVELDSKYAQAWALMAIAQSSLHYGFGARIDDGFAAANAALSIDPRATEAYCALSHRLQEQGKLAEAVREIEKALSIDPASWEVNKEAGRLALAERRVADAARYYECATQAMDSDFHAWSMLATCYQALGDEAGVQRCAEKMVGEAERALTHDPGNGAALGILAGGLAISGQTERAREWIDRAMLLDPDNINMRYNFACVLGCHMNDTEAAIRQLSVALSQSKTHLNSALSDPDFDCLRGHPKFSKLLELSAKKFGITLPGAP